MTGCSTQWVQMDPFVASYHQCVKPQTFTPSCQNIALLRFKLHHCSIIGRTSPASGEFDIALDPTGNFHPKPFDETPSHVLDPSLSLTTVYNDMSNTHHFEEVNNNRN